MTPQRLFTIGVYGFTENAFRGRLREAGVDLFCDVRARRGLRGPEYAFANAKRLQSILEAERVRYLYLKELAPPATVRDSQRAEDAKHGVAKRSRAELGAAFCNAYRNLCLSDLEASELFRGPLANSKRPVFFCVERSPHACHRSLLAEELAQQSGVEVEHLLP